MYESLSDCEIEALFRRLFPNGFAGADVFDELAPDGWENSPLLRAFHPTLKQWHHERVARHRNFEAMGRLFGNKADKPEAAGPSTPEPTLEDSRREFADRPVNARDECTEIVGAVAWEIFSDNHSVVTADGRKVDLGSWRAASSFLSDFADRPGAAGYRDSGDCMRFYMGLLWIRQRCDYRPVYRLVFRRLKHETLDWKYSFPRLHVFRFDSERTDHSAPHEYNPSESFAREQKRKSDEEEWALLKARLDEEDAKARKQARAAPPPAIVQAYRDVFGHWPDGSPP